MNCSATDLQNMHLDLVGCCCLGDASPPVVMHRFKEQLTKTGLADKRAAQFYYSCSRCHHRVADGASHVARVARSSISAMHCRATFFKRTPGWRSTRCPPTSSAPATHRFIV
jgi:hypothetical protein